MPGILQKEFNILIVILILLYPSFILVAVKSTPVRGRAIRNKRD
jgi:hypothetical protein